MKKSSVYINSNLNRAKISRNNEFFTRELDVRNELFFSKSYERCFEGKIVLCNCNDMNKSGFEGFFRKFFSFLDLKELIAVSYCADSVGTVMRYNGKSVIYNSLMGNGDYYSDECLKLLEESDIVCTNPPFSMFRDFLLLLTKYNKDFLIVGNINEMMCNDIFPLFKSGKIWYGQTMIKQFNTPKGERKKFGNIGWYTNIGRKGEKLPIDMPCRYEWDHRHYPKYDNYDAINVPTLKDLPYDYGGEMGVPGTYLLIHNPEQFELIGTSGTLAEDVTLPDGTIKKNPGRFYIKGKRLYDRIIIRRKGV